MHCLLALAFVRTVQFFRPINNERKFIFPSAIFLRRCCFIALSWYVSRWKSYGTTYKSGIRSWSAVHAHYFNDDALLFLQAVGDKHRLEPMLIVVAERLVDRSFSRLLGGKWPTFAMVMSILFWVVPLTLPYLAFASQAIWSQAHRDHRYSCIFMEPAISHQTSSVTFASSF